MKKLAGLLILATGAWGAAPTYNHDIAPILYQNCAGCHRPGEVAPFSLLTYQDTAKRATLIASITQARVMPPWKAAYDRYRLRAAMRASDTTQSAGAHWSPECHKGPP